VVLEDIGWDFSSKSSSTIVICSCVGMEVTVTSCSFELSDFTGTKNGLQIGYGTTGFAFVTDCDFSRGTNQILFSAASVTNVTDCEFMMEGTGQAMSQGAANVNISRCYFGEISAGTGYVIYFTTTSTVRVDNSCFQVFNSASKAAFGNSNAVTVYFRAGNCFSHLTQSDAMKGNVKSVHEHGCIEPNYFYKCDVCGSYLPCCRLVR
jgi:hypothetical protein